MRTLLRILLLALVTLAFVWVAWRVEFAGKTIWERVSGKAAAHTDDGVPHEDGPPLERVTDEERKALDDLVRRQRTRPRG